MIAPKQYSKIIWLHALLIMAIGLAALYSASFNNTRIGQAVFYDQLGAAGLSLFIMAVLGQLTYSKFFDIAYLLYAASIVFLVLVLFLGREAMGATRWFSVGSFSFQPSEFSKFAIILFLGRYFSQRRPKLSFNMTSSMRGLADDLLLPFALTMVSVGLIYKQPDLGTAILIFSIFLILLYASGISARIFMFFVGFLVVCVPFGWHFLKPYQRDRLLVFINPNYDPMGAGYTIIQSKIAIGSGQVFGKGWLTGTQNQLNFLPERHTDFIFSVIGEEWGFVGGALLLYCYAAVVYCGLEIAARHKDRFGQLVAVGITGILALQVVINIGMVMGLFPVVGITLPLISYGRTSFIVFAVMLGFLLSLSKKRTMF